jgi:hypothetical protein
MTTVIISDQIRVQVADAIRKMYESKMHEAAKYPDGLGDSITERLYENYTEEQTMRALPARYFNTFNELNIETRAYDTHVLHLSRDYIAPYEFGPTCGIDDYYINSNILQFRIKDAIKFQDVITEFAKRKVAIEKAKTHREAAVEKAMTVLKTFKTLAPALKAWPALWNLLPKHIQERHKLVVEKTREKKSIPDDLNMDDLTVMVAARALKDGQHTG